MNRLAQLTLKQSLILIFLLQFIAYVCSQTPPPQPPIIDVTAKPPTIASILLNSQQTQNYTATLSVPSMQSKSSMASQHSSQPQSTLSQPQLNWSLQKNIDKSLPLITIHDLSRSIRCLTTITHVVPVNHPLAQQYQYLLSQNEQDCDDHQQQLGNNINNNNNNIATQSQRWNGGLTPNNQSYMQQFGFNNNNNNNNNQMTTIHDVIIIEKSLLHIIRDYFHDICETLYSLLQLQFIDATLYNPITSNTNHTPCLLHSSQSFTLQRPHFSSITQQFGNYAASTPALSTYLIKVHQQERTSFFTINV